ARARLSRSASVNPAFSNTANCCQNKTLMKKRPNIQTCRISRAMASRINNTDDGAAAAMAPTANPKIISRKNTPYTKMHSPAMRELYQRFSQFYSGFHAKESWNFPRCCPKIHIGPARLVGREQSALYFPLAESLDVRRAVFYTLHANDPFFGHPLIIQHPAFRIQH